jgi:lipopolysaccharide biosynthesis regulator YciM
VIGARPDDEQATRSLAAFYRKQGRADDAINLLEEYRAQFGGTRAVDLLLMTLYATERDGETLEEFLESVGEEMAPVVEYECGHCGHNSELMRWYCPRCSHFDSFDETT